MAGFNKIKVSLKDENGKTVFEDKDWVEIEYEKFYDGDDVRFFIENKIMSVYGHNTYKNHYYTLIIETNGYGIIKEKIEGVNEKPSVYFRKVKEHGLPEEFDFILVLDSSFNLFKGYREGNYWNINSLDNPIINHEDKWIHFRDLKNLKTRDW